MHHSGRNSRLSIRQTSAQLALLLLVLALPAWSADDKTAAATEAERNIRATKLGIPDPATAGKQTMPATTKRMSLEHEDPKEPLELGKELAYRGKYAKAIAVLSEVIKNNPNQAKAYTVRAYAYEGLGSHAEAIADATKAISIDPSDPEAYGTRMKAYGASHQIEASGADEKSVIQLHEQKLMKGADSYLVRCNEKIKHDPNVSTNYVERAGAYRGLRQFQKALDDYNEAIKRDPHNYLAYINRAQIYLQMNKHDLADQDFALAQQLVQQKKGKVLTKSGK